MAHRLILASGSQIRQKMLGEAGVSFSTIVEKVDETAIRKIEESKGSSPQEIAETLAMAKAKKVSARENGALVIGCDQILAFGQEIFAKPETIEDAHQQLCYLRGKAHKLFSAAAIFKDGAEIWQYTGQVTLKMRDFTDSYLEGYLERNWQSVRHSVGAYKLEEEGVRLFSAIEGDYFTVLGMPLLPLLAYLSESGELEQ